MTRIGLIIYIKDPKEALNMDCQQNTKKNIIFEIKSLVPIEVLTSVVLYYIT